METKIKQFLKILSKRLIEYGHIKPGEILGIGFSGNPDEYIYIPNVRLSKIVDDEGTLIDFYLSEDEQNILRNLFENFFEERLFKILLEKYPDVEINSFYGLFLINIYEGEVKIKMEYRTIEETTNEVSGKMDLDETDYWEDVPKSVFSCEFSGTDGSGEIDYSVFEPELSTREKFIYEDKYYDFFYELLSNWFSAWKLDEGSRGKGKIDLINEEYSINITQFYLEEFTLKNDIVFYF
jgi:hypothetical protein